MAREIDFSYYIGRLKALQDEIDRLRLFHSIRLEALEDDSHAQELIWERDALIKELCSLLRGKS